jgi:hypothetical protein
MIIRSKSNIRRLQPSKREHLDFVQYQMHETCCIVEQTMISFVPRDPNACKPNKLQKRPTSSWTSSWECELNQMITESRGINRWKANPIANKCPQGPKRTARRNKCWAVSMLPQPDTQKWASEERIPQATKFSFIGSLSRKRRHAKMETFEGICLCHTRSTSSPAVNVSWEVKSWYAPLTK